MRLNRWVLVVLGFWAWSGGAQAPVGTWIAHLPYVEGKETVYCGDGGATGFWATRTAEAVFTYRMEDGTLNTWSTVTGLSSASPTALLWDGEAEVLLIGYADGTVDWVAPDGTVVFTLTDIRESNLIGSKAINALRGPFAGRRILAACDFGIVALDGEGRYVADTWYPEGSGSPRSVREVMQREGAWVAVTDAGIFEASTDAAFLAAPDAWTRWEDVPMEAGDYRDLVYTPDGQSIVHWHQPDASPSDQIWVRHQGMWQPLPNYDGITVRALEADSDASTWRLAVADWNAIHQFDADFEPIKLDYSAAGKPLRVNDLVFHHAADSTFQDLFVANAGGGLLRMDLFDAPRDAQWAPDGPPVSAVRSVDCWNDNCWVASGGVDGAWTSLYNEYGMFGLVGREWVHLDAGEGSNDITGVRDFMSVSIDPFDPGHVCFGSWEDGIFEVQDGEVVAHFTSANSSLQEANFGGSLRTGVGGLDFDLNGNLWVANAFVESPLQVRTTEGEWVTMDIGNALGADGFIEQVLAARNGYVWAVIPRGGGVLVYDPAGTPEDVSDDDWRVLTKENAGLASNNVLCIEEDLDGEIWLGTESGPSVVYLPAAVFESGFVGDLASSILIEQDGNFQYLLETEAITSICIDGGNRKWLATQTSGVYLVEADGLEQVAHFTADNSPLLSDNVFDVAINHGTGEVFFATERGLVSLIGEGTNFVAEIDALKVYPNPVRPGYEGGITVDGCAYNSTVHVTDVGGRWVATLNSEGGRAVWDGRRADGSLAPYGMYLIFATDSEGKSGGVTPLAITR